MSGSRETSRLARSWFRRRPTGDGAFHTASLLWLAGIALLTVPMVTLVDVSVARSFRTRPIPSELADFLELTRVLSHGGGIFLILLGIGLMFPANRWHIPRLAAISMGAGAVATIAKMFVLRPRPDGLNLDIATYDSAWLWAFDWNLEQVATFDASTRAFPSGNMATAVALSVGLWVVLPRGRWLFAFLCTGALIQRLHTGTHFLSDLFGGAAFGLLWAYVCFHPKLLGSVFDQMESDQNRRRRRRREPIQSEEPMIADDDTPNIITLPGVAENREPDQERKVA